MFDANMIGSYISFMRKKMNLTQSRLAEELGVSHQAVSNWERGEAMPDISFLQKIARILETTTDRILAAGEIDDEDEEPLHIEKPIDIFDTVLYGSETDLPAEAENESIGEDKNMDMETGNIKKDTPNDGYFEDTRANDVYERVLVPNNDGGFSEAYVLKSSLSNAKSDSGSKKIDASGEEHENNALPVEENISSDVTWKKVCKLAPFASSETLDKLVRSVVINDDAVESTKITLKHIRRLAPFLGKDSLDLLVRHMSEKADWDGIVSLAPYLGKNSLNKLIENIDLQVDFQKIISLAPFLGSEDIENLVEHIDEKTSYDQIIALAPFLSSKAVDKLIMDAITTL